MSGNPFEEIPLQEEMPTLPTSPSTQPTTTTTMPPVPPWRPRSCIILIGTTNRGKTTTMNVYTGNAAAARGGSAATTTTTKIYRDSLPEHRVVRKNVNCRCCVGGDVDDEVADYPVWMDTIGLHEAGADATREELVKDYLKVLFKSRIEYVHAVIWCIEPEEARTTLLQEEAEVIKLLVGNCDADGGIGGNIILLVKRPYDDPLGPKSPDIQGALACLDGWRSTVHIEGYYLHIDETKAKRPGQISIAEARSRLNDIFCRIAHPLKLKWEYRICLDCGQMGDWRMFDNVCHLQPERVERFEGCLAKFHSTVCFCCGWKKTICSHCKQLWPKENRRGISVRSRPCVQISDFDKVRHPFVRCPVDKTHNLRAMDDKLRRKFEKKFRKSET